MASIQFENPPTKQTMVPAYKTHIQDAGPVRHVPSTIGTYNTARKLTGGVAGGTIRATEAAGVGAAGGAARWQRRWGEVEDDDDSVAKSKKTKQRDATSAER